jgi:hypothetical protein
LLELKKINTKRGKNGKKKNPQIGRKGEKRFISQILQNPKSK